MKKTLVAIAVTSAIAPLGVYAQSSVTAFGVVDVASVSKTHTAYNGTVLSKTNGIGEGFNAGNRIGFRGTEDLGGGLSANFWVENGINITNGALFSTRAAAGGQQVDGVSTSGGIHSNMPSGAYSTGTNRQSYVSLKDNAKGEIRLGYQYTNLYELTSLSGYHLGSEQPGGDVMHGTMSSGMYGSTRANGITYISPTFNGVTIRAQYGAGTGREVAEFSTAASSPTANTTLRNNRQGLLVRYANGPLDASLAFTQYRVETAAIAASSINTTTGTISGGSTNIFSAVTGIASSTAATNQTNNLVQLGGSYVLGNAKLTYHYHRGTINDSTTSANTAVTKAQQYGLEYTLGTVRPYLISGKGQITSNDTGANIMDAKSVQYGVRYDLSKRTMLYAITGNITDSGSVVTGSTITKRAATGIGLYHTF